MDTGIRSARADDLPELTEIINHYVRETPTTFDVEPYTVESRRPWLESFAESGPHRLFVAVEEEQVLGWAGSMRFRPKAAYDVSIETSVYLRPDAAGRGLGTRLYGALFQALEDEDLHRVYAGITLPNAASIRLHQRLSFRPIGVFHEVGRKRGCYWDVAWFEKELVSRRPGSDPS